MKAPKNILVVTYWSFFDALIQTYTLPYLKIIQQQLPPNSKIFLVTLEKENYEQIVELTDSTIVLVKFKYTSFGISASLAWVKHIIYLKKLIRKNNISFIHTFCTPAGMIGYLLSKLTQKPLILDSYEPHAEAMVENGEWKKNSWSYKILFYFEKKQTQHAQIVIGTTKAMYNYALQKYAVKLNTFFFKPACVDLDTFNLRYKKDKKLLAELDLTDKIVCVYAGKFGGIYLKDEVFAFYKIAYQRWQHNFVALILTNHSLDEINALIAKYELPESMFRICFVPHSQINKYIGLGDFAITPVKPVNTKKYCTPIKDGEYWAMGLPIVITKNISVDSAIIENNNIGYVLKALTTLEYTNATEKIDHLLNDTTISVRIRKIAELERNYTIATKVYKTIYG